MQVLHPLQNASVEQRGHGGLEQQRGWVRGSAAAHNEPAQQQKLRPDFWLRCIPGPTIDYSTQHVELLAAGAGVEPVDIYERAAAMAFSKADYARVLSLVKRANTGVLVACQAFVAVGESDLAVELARYVLDRTTLPLRELQQVANFLLENNLIQAAMDPPGPTHEKSTDRKSSSNPRVVLHDFLVSNFHYDCQLALQSMGRLCCDHRTAENMVAVGLARQQCKAAFAMAEKTTGGILVLSIARHLQRLMVTRGIVGQELQPEVIQVAEIFSFLPARDWIDAMMHQDSLALRSSAVVKQALCFLDSSSIGAVTEYFDRWVHAAPTEQELLTGTQLNERVELYLCLLGQCQRLQEEEDAATDAHTGGLTQPCRRFNQEYLEQALRQQWRAYDAETMKQHCLQTCNLSATAVILELQQDWPSALLLRLSELETVAPAGANARDAP